MATVARTVHLHDPETGELHTLVKGTEISDDEYEAFTEKFNNPSIFEDPDAPADKDLASLSDEEFYFAADANGTVDEENFDEFKDAREPSAEGGVSFDIDQDYEDWKMPRLQKEVQDRREAGREITVEGRDKDAYVAALRADDDDAGNA